VKKAVDRYKPIPVRWVWSFQQDVLTGFWRWIHPRLFESGENFDYSKSEITRR
jgi:hypothetical protein